MKCAVIIAAVAAVAADAMISKVAGTCDPGTYFHDRGSYDCDPTDNTCDSTAPSAACCCPCAAGFYCPGDSESRYAEEPCLPGTSSPPGSTSFSQCTGPAPVISQIHVAYTGVASQLSVDWVSTQPGAGRAYTSLDGATWVSIPATTFPFPNVGYLSQALLAWSGPELAPGQVVHYMVGVQGVGNSTPYSVTPVVAGLETYVVYGDFGAANDVCMQSLISDSKGGAFDSVLHVGDWAYDFDTANSSVGNVFMATIQAYAAVHPVMPAEGNHEACTSCPVVPVVPYSNSNFSEYTARMWSVGSVGAGKVSGTGTPRYYSFNQGMAHFLVFTAEAYAYDSGAAFLANQLAFMKADLAGVDRSVTPWVVGLVHKAFWMQEDAYAAFNPVLMDGGVDLIFAGHVHYYNRLYPYNNVTGAIDTACVSADGHTYTNPAFPTYLISGAPGDREDTSGYRPGLDAWSYTGSSNYGYGFVSFPNATHAQWSWKTIKPAGTDPVQFDDSLTIVQNNHGWRNGGRALFE